MPRKRFPLSPTALSPTALSPTAVASGPPGSGVAHPFEVVFQAPPADKYIVLLAATDANKATIAFHAALRRLTALGVTGELLVRHRHRPHHPLVRLPLTTRS
jgi:hypothetical protein